MARLFTIGYEGSDVDQLIETLKNLKVEVLADVRELPLSRKKGLSKTGLAENLAEVGIKYIHFKQLGDPKAGREAAKRGDYQLFERIYLNHLHSHGAQVELASLLRVASDSTSCMMCFERCATTCHRSYIADLAANAGFIVHNVTADDPKKYLRNDIRIPRYNPRQGLTAAE